MRISGFTFLLFFSILSVHADDDKTLKESEIVDFSSIKEVLRKDGLNESAGKKATKVKVIKRDRTALKRKMYDIPGNREFWTFFSEYWLVKNAPVLKWDFKKPDYGLEESFAALLEKLGFFEKKFKILLLDTPGVTHFALPANPDEMILLLSVPFIRQMDLSKLEISLLLFEDFIRENHELFRRKVENSEFKKILSGNFFQGQLEVSLFEEMLKKYDEVVFDNGFTFQEQFEVTKRVGDILKSDLKLWSAYNGLVKKIDGLVKTNVLYKDYSKIYPSPEMQLNWLNPVK